MAEIKAHRWVVVVVVVSEIRVNRLTGVCVFVCLGRGDGWFCSPFWVGGRG